MSAFLLDAARHIGAPLLTRVLERRIGGANTRLASEVVDAVARRVGVAPDALQQAADDNPSRLVDAMRETEAGLPEMIALYAQGLEGQFALLQAESKGPWWGWAWRPFMMWLLAGLWLWNIVLLHVANAIWRIALPTTDSATLLALTSVYMALYMGGHTLKDFVRVTRGGA